MMEHARRNKTLDIDTRDEIHGMACVFKLEDEKRNDLIAKGIIQ